jgi:hypothetical protein
LNPLEGLAGFQNYEGLTDPALPPTRAELVSQIATADLLRAVIARTDPCGAATPELSPAPHATSVRNWVEAIDDGELRHRVSAATGVAPQNYSAQLTANRLSPELAVATSRAAGVGLTGGLVATGLVAEAEAGWLPGARREALAGLSDAELTLLAGDRLQALGRTLRRHEQEQAQAERIWENLG